MWLHGDEICFCEVERLRNAYPEGTKVNVNLPNGESITGTVTEVNSLGTINIDVDLGENYLLPYKSLKDVKVSLID